MIYCSLHVPVHEMPQKKWLLHHEMQLYLTKDIIIYGSENNHIIGSICSVLSRLVLPCKKFPAVEQINLHWLASYGLKYISTLNETVQTKCSSEIVSICHKDIKISGENI